MIPTTTTEPVAQLNAQRQAGESAWTQEAYAAARRHEGVREAVALLVEGRPGSAYYRLMRSYVEQVRILGLGYAAIPGYDEGGPLDGAR